MSDTNVKPLVWIDWETLEVVFANAYGNASYRADLEDFTTAAKALDWIFQIGRKTWCSPQMLSDLIEVLDVACVDVFDREFQGVFCPFGQTGTRVNWKKRTVKYPKERK